MATELRRPVGMEEDRVELFEVVGSLEVLLGFTELKLLKVAPTERGVTFTPLDTMRPEPLIPEQPAIATVRCL